MGSEMCIRDRDPGALAAAVAPEAVLYSTAPFRPRDPDGVWLVDHVEKLLDQEFTIDPARKQVARDTVVWTVRVSVDVAAPQPGRAEAELDDAGRVTVLRLGPAG